MRSAPRRVLFSVRGLVRSYSDIQLHQKEGTPPTITNHRPLPAAEVKCYGMLFRQFAARRARGDESLASRPRLAGTAPVLALTQPQKEVAPPAVQAVAP